MQYNNKMDKMLNDYEMNSKIGSSQVLTDLIDVDKN